ncbi:Hydroxypyruvate isomerase [Anaerohalosphaera lusitana]|uniref:Hydroxypyruvate isomerase n=1 Tax=Anaerohalosphaera lusitana TaxID=1936003 RepID=A0A1U9NHA8_9BACT|nr:sugar phosphate isomerase/epimerase family protein [Anaerohalosphaera lusitana]AQT67299.1 Hydroxypyruvate isomerase [Anaerohalosphaera lusitana]
MRHKLGIFSFFGYRLSLTTRVKLIRQAGFEMTGLWWHEFAKGAEPLKDRPRIVRDHGLELDNVHIPYRGAKALWSREKSRRQRYVDYCRECLEDCARHDIGKMVMHLSVGNKYVQPNGHGLDTLRQLAEFAENVGVDIAFENTRHIEMLDAVLDQIDSPAVSFCYDTGHDNVWGEPAGQIAVDWAERMSITHLSDNRGIMDWHSPIGEGNYDWPFLAETLSRCEYAGPLMLEVFTRDRELPPRVFLDNCFHGLRNFAKMVAEQSVYQKQETRTYDQL